MKPSDDLYRQTAYDAEIDRYIRAAQNGEDTDWTRFDEDANSRLLAQLNAILRGPRKWTSDFMRKLKCIQAAILALEAIDKHIEYCAREHAEQCRQNGRL